MSFGFSCREFPLGKTMGVIDDTMPRWLTGENPRAPPIGNPVKAMACPSLTESELTIRNAGSGLPAMLSTARSCSISLLATAAGLNCAVSGEWPGIKMLKRVSESVVSGKTWALVAT